MNRRNKKSLQKNISKKSLLKTFLILFITFSLIYLSILIKRIDIPVILPVEEIHVLGEFKFLNADDIKAKVKANIVGGYFTVDMNLIREVLVQEPWIKTVTLRRQWPASLNVSVEERTPIAYWNKDAYLSESGEVFTPTSIDPELNLPTLNGPQGRHTSVWQFMNVLYQEMARLNYQVVRLDLDQRRAWQLVIESAAIDNASTAVENDEGSNLQTLDSAKHTINVRLGRFDTEKRLQRFVRILPSLINEQRNREAAIEIDAEALATNEASGVISDETPVITALGRIKTIDMRYPNGFAVQRTSGTQISKTLLSAATQHGGRA